MKLKVKGSHIISLTKYPGEEKTTQVLLVAGILTPPVADKLKIREGCFNEEGVPRNYDSFPSPSARVNGAEVFLGADEYRANLIHKFKVKQPRAGGDNDISLELSFRIHFDGDLPLFAVVDNLNKTQFVLGINARQADLNFGDEEEDGDTAEEEDSDSDTGCVSCNNDVEMGLNGYHTNGQRCTRKDAPTVLASAREAAGGTHQRKKRVEAGVQ